MYSLIPSRTTSLMNNFFNDEAFKWPESTHGMSTDIVTTDTGYGIVMNLPGYEKDEINVSAKSDVLTITAEKKTETEEKNDNYVRRERFEGKRSRSFSLKGIDQDSIDAGYENGVLTLKLTKEAKYLTDKVIDIK